jgi:type II secretory ATPase GspE/PulE/Tfp pilus assembly ATPase PilB-like protein
MDLVLRDLITNNAAENDIRKHSLKTGMKPLVHHGLEKVKAGTTSIEELLRVVLVE